MNRKLRSSFNALMVTAALGTAAALAAAWVPSAARAASVQATPVHVGAHHRTGHLSRIRHSLAMPYFSFVPRG